MNILKLFTKETPLRQKASSGQEKMDKYQIALNVSGKEQFAKLLQKGLQIPIVLL